MKHTIPQIKREKNYFYSQLRNNLFYFFLSVFAILYTAFATVCTATDLPTEINPEYSRWNAVVITAQEKYITEYLTGATLSSTCNYRKNAVVDTRQHSFHITTQTTNAEFGWTDQRIGNDWAPYWYPYEIHFYIQQTKQLSRWKVNGKPFILRGTHRQRIKFKMGSMRYRLDKIIFSTDIPHNEILLSHPEIVRPSALRYFRKTYDISRPVKKAHIVISTSPEFSLYINGVPVIQKGAGSDFERIYTLIDITEYLKQGENIIAVSAELYSWKHELHKPSLPNNKFFLEGIFYFDDGSYKRIYTDSSWKSSFTFAESWQSAEFDDSHWQSAHPIGSVTDLLSGYGKSGRGWYTNPPYFGPIQIALDNKKFPFFHETETCIFDVSVLTPSTKSLTLKAAIHNFISGSLKKTVLLKSGDWRDGVMSFDFEPLSLPQGSYLLTLTLTTDNTHIDTRHYEFLVLGKISQTEITQLDYSNIALNKVDEINCVTINPFKKRNFLSSYTTLLKKNDPKDFSRIKMSPLGLYRESNQNRYAWMSYEIAVKNLYKPHLITIHYPDDKERTMGITIHERPTFETLSNIYPDSGILRASTGIYTGGVHPLSNKMQTHTFLYWPNHHRAAITILNDQHKTGAAVQKIEVFEFEQDLPALQIRNDLNQCKIGAMSERAPVTLPQTFYAGPLKSKFMHNLKNSSFLGYYKAWYITLKNFIVYLNFTGQNLFIPSLYMYYGAQYPSPHYGFAENGINLSMEPSKDYVALMAAMFEYNDLSLILGIEFIGSSDSLNRADTFSDSDIRNPHTDTRRLVSRTGKQAYTSWMQGGLNPVHPDNISDFLTVIDDCSSSCKDFPAIKGMALYLGEALFPSFGSFKKKQFNNEHDSLSWGYGDTTISQFENDTRITLPIEYTAPNRFSKRHTYLLSHHKEEWISWRNEQIKKTILKAHNLIQMRRNDWHLYLYSMLPHRDDVTDIMRHETNVHNIMRTAGLDPLLYRDIPGISWTPFLRQTAARWLKVKQKDYLNADLQNTYLTLPELHDIFDFGTETSAFLHTGFMTEGLARTEKEWLWGQAFLIGYPVPAGRNFLNTYATTMSLLAPTTLKLFWTDMTHKVGNEEALASFTQAYRTLPAQNYHRVCQNDTLTLSGALYQNEFYFFVVNTSSKQQQATLQFNKNFRIKNLVTNQYIALTPQNNYYNADLHIDSYELQTFKIEQTQKIPKITISDE